MKRVVTGLNSGGKSVVLLEGEPARVSTFPNLPGLALHEIWATEARASVPASTEDPTLNMSRFIAPPGGTRFRIEIYQPDAKLAELAANGAIDLAQGGAEFAAAMPDIAAVLEPDFMHTTDTIDYNIVLSGELWCELDDGAEVQLRPGDCLVQTGTRHAWRNKGNVPCVKAAIMVGAVRSK